MEGEHSIGVNADANIRIEEAFPVGSVPGRVQIEQDLAKFFVFSCSHVEQRGLPMHCDRQLLAGQVGRADVRTLSDVANTQGIRRRSEVERSPLEDSVDRPSQRATVRGHSRQGQKPHTRQPST